MLRVVLVFGLYLGAGELGLSMPFTSSNVSPVWPASGVALAAVLVWGWEILPGIALAAFLVNFFSRVPPMAAIGIAVGNTASALFGGYLFRRFAGLQVPLSPARCSGPNSHRELGARLSQPRSEPPPSFSQTSRLGLASQVRYSLYHEFSRL
jgi:hypothetical protein